MPDYIKSEKHGHVFTIAFNRPDANNAFNTKMLRELSAAYQEMENDSDVGWVSSSPKASTSPWASS